MLGKRLFRVPGHAVNQSSNNTVGILPLVRAELLAMTIERYRLAQASGIRVSIEILPTPGCLACQEQTGVHYSLENVPTLPLAGCTRLNGCGCVYSPAC
jgi:hypothetical protein